MATPHFWPPQKIISGGQTGVDRAALNVALELGIGHGGWCPRGRLAEDGRIPKWYQLEETDSADYDVRTRRNVGQSDGTLVVHRGPLGPGTRLTRNEAQQTGKPCLCVDLADPLDVADVRRWAAENNIRVLNVAGPRESFSPGIGAAAKEWLLKLLRERKS